MKKSTHIITTLLEVLNPELDIMVDKIFKRENEDLIKNGFPAVVHTEYHRKWQKLMLMRDIIKSFSNYVKGDDVLGSEFSTRKCPKGTLMIDADIFRDGKKYYISTSMIYAEGLVQRLHYRILVNTSLPKSGDKTKLDEINEKIKKLTKKEKIQKDVELYQGYLEKYENEYATKSVMTDEEILKTSGTYWYLIMTYDQINRESHNWKIWQDNPQGWEENQEKERKDFISEFRRRTEIIKNHNIKSVKKDIEKHLKKLAEYSDVTL